MKAFVTQASASGEPPSAAAIAGRANAGPVKLSGIDSPAKQTAERINRFSTVCCVAASKPRKLELMQSSDEVWMFLSPTACFRARKQAVQSAPAEIVEGAQS
ncbi:hypothetical protein AB1286_20760 [Trinickia sp. NRRL B-1857]|uniref:hypothetical protein n=1 Tax=Trinickia sp. NRRL B-1857 TaxID=3162879 RepID=UPI003D28C7AE